MKVLRCVPNVATADAQEASKVAQFYRDLFDMDIVMDQGWIVTVSSAQQAPAQVSAACEGGSGQAVPALTVEVDDLEEVVKRAEALGLSIGYGPVTEPWGVRRLFVRDPVGTLLNVMCHSSS